MISRRTTEEHDTSERSLKLEILLAAFLHSNIAFCTVPCCVMPLLFSWVYVALTCVVHVVFEIGQF